MGRAGRDAATGRVGRVGGGFTAFGAPCYGNKAPAGAGNLSLGGGFVVGSVVRQTPRMGIRCERVVCQTPRFRAFGGHYGAKSSCRLDY